MNDYLCGKPIEIWGGGEARQITFIVTEDCNLRCGYCYIGKKTKGKVMSLSTAMDFIDMIFNNGIHKGEKAVVLDFIGGEPFLEAGLLGDIVDYFVRVAYTHGSPWWWNFRINITTNGVNYNNPKVQKFVDKYYFHLSIGFSIDGNQEKHDLQRVFPDGSGSYEKVMKNADLWMKRFIGNTKATFSSDDLMYLKDSIVTLINSNIKYIAANVVFEDVWKPGDPQTLETQLKELADYIIDNELYNQVFCGFFHESIGGYYDLDDMNQPFCGAGKIITCGPDGNLYPCLRFKQYSLSNQKELIVGNVNDGIDYDRLKVFEIANLGNKSSGRCLKCNVGKGCGYCQGLNYDESRTGTNFNRATHICQMHKARIRANDYYFNKLRENTGIKRNNHKLLDRSLFLIMETSKAVQICDYNIDCCSEKEEILNRSIGTSLAAAYKTCSIPVILHSKTKLVSNPRDYDGGVLHVYPFKYFDEINVNNEYGIGVVVSQSELTSFIDQKHKIHFAVINIDNLNKFDIGAIQMASCKTEYLYLNLLRLNTYRDEDLYEFMQYINQLRSNMDYSNIELIGEAKFRCRAGSRDLTVGPDGKTYPCPGFYYTGIEDYSIPVEELEESITFPDRDLFFSDKAPLCKECKAILCRRCVLDNRRKTGEISIPSDRSCQVGYILSNLPKKTPTPFVHYKECHPSAADKQSLFRKIGS